ncbi:MAG: hypothetical protein HKN33_16450 [Pyrinomonadaceae bacterium]|nr:hypothetical protein [Pyrinomonadaceae bacterium]
MSFGRKVFSFVTLLVAIAALGIVTFAQETPAEDKEKVEKQRIEGRKGRMGRQGQKGFRGGRGMRHGRRGGMIRGLRRLNLSETQRSQVRTLAETHKNTQQPTIEEMRALRGKFRDGTATEDDKARMGELRAQMKASSEELRTSILGVLTPEQLEQLETMKAERRQRMEQRRQRMLERRQQREQQKQPEKTDN